MMEYSSDQLHHVSAQLASNSVFKGRHDVLLSLNAGLAGFIFIDKAFKGACVGTTASKASTNHQVEAEGSRYSPSNYNMQGKQKDFS